MKDTAIEIINLHKSFGQVQAVKGLNLEVHRGEIFGFLGPNGAGKTTTIRTMLNFIIPDQGKIKILGQNPAFNSQILMREIGYIAGDIALWDNYKVGSFLNALEDIRGESGAIRNSLIERFQLDEHKKIKSLSKGNKQKVAIIQAFMHEPKVLILDEPSSGLDPILQNEFYHLLAEVKHRGGTVFFSSHVLSEVQKVCDRVAVIKDGELVSIEAISELRNKNIFRIELTYSGKGPAENNFGKDNIENFETSTNNLIRFTYKGEINSLLAILNQFDLTNLTISEPSIEDIFLAYYN